MKKILIFIIVLLLSSTAFAGEEARSAYTLSDIINFALINSPAIAAAEKSVEAEKYSVDSAKSEKNFKLNFNASAMKYEYSIPLVPISGPITSLANLPPFDNSIGALGATFNLPLYTGGRIEGNISVKEYEKLIAENNLKLQKQELIYNLSGIYYKIMQFEKDILFFKENIKQFEDHKRDAEFAFKAGTAPKIELIKTETKLAQARHNLLLVENGLESSYELLKTLMGYEKNDITIIYEDTAPREILPVEDCVKKTLLQRPDYKAALNKIKMNEARKKTAQSLGKPNINFNGFYYDNIGNNQMRFVDNWQAGFSLAIPILDGGLMAAEVEKNKKNIEKAKKEEEALRQNIVKEIKDAYLNIENARGRIAVLKDSIALAEENYRIEKLKFKAGVSTSTDLFDAQADLLRTKTDYWQAVYDEKIALAALKKAMGDE